MPETLNYESPRGLEVVYRYRSSVWVSPVLLGIGISLIALSVWWNSAWVFFIGLVPGGMGFIELGGSLEIVFAIDHGRNCLVMTRTEDGEVRRSEYDIRLIDRFEDAPIPDCDNREISSTVVKLKSGEKVVVVDMWTRSFWAVRKLNEALDRERKKQ